MTSRIKRKGTEPIIYVISSSSESDNEFAENVKRKKLNDSDYLEPKSKKKTSKSISSTRKRATKKDATKRTANTQNKNEKENCIEIGKETISEQIVPTEKKTNSNNVQRQKDTNDGGNCVKLRRYNPNRQWEIYELLSELEDIDHRSSRNIINLFEEENTIPFICRYRRDMIRSDICAEKLRDIKNTYCDLVALKKRSQGIIKQLEKDGQLTKEIENQIVCARTADEIEFLYAPYKPANKGTLADRAKTLGLEPYAHHILYGNYPPLDIESLVNHSQPDLNSINKVIDGICHIMSHIYSKSTSVLEELRRLQKITRITLVCSKAKSSKDNKEEKKYDPKADETKYENYFNFQNSIQYIKPHQVLAINRGEKSKVLSVKIIVPDRVKTDIRNFIKNEFLCDGFAHPLRTQLFEKSFEECYSKKLQPYLCRQIRSDLNEIAKKASIEVFAKNLKQLLLMSPLKGESILGIDSGFSNGCKLALISKNAEVLETGVIYPHAKFDNPRRCGEKVAEMMNRHGCSLIALGNGTACRETELWITKLFQEKILDPVSVKYSIVSEQGASIYSCSEVAKKEFPKMDVNLISAVSIARRLNDPLSEYVKIEPKHIGVGMYQHDINEKLLIESLNEVVTECVSFVGVDVNTASLSVLKYISGLTASRAEKILEYRAKNGPFKTRKDILKVKNIGEKTFTQCAGFIRIEPLSVGGPVTNLLDCTWVHPESYEIAKKIILKCDLKLQNIGKKDFINRISSYKNSTSIDDLAAEFKVPKERVTVVFEALERELLQDYRSDFDKKPLFKQGITSIKELRVDSQVTGAVTNITHFGAFVDIGVDRDGLIHTSKMNGMTLNIGDRVEATVSNVDIQKNRIQLKLNRILY